jgi:hypothetical protein
MREGGRSPTHDHFAQSIVFRRTKWFGQNICPVEIGGHLGDNEGSIPKVVLKMVPLQGEVLSPRFGSITVCQNDAGGIVFKNLASLDVGCPGNGED